MAPTFRGPIPIQSNSYHRSMGHPADPIFWNGIESDYSERMIVDPPYQRTTTMRSKRSSSASRQYIDPWDMENYDYILRKNIDSSSEQSFTTPSPAGEPVSSTFYYVPGGVDETSSPGRTCYAGLDEKSFYNAKFSGDEFDVEAAYSTYTDIETSSGDRNSSCGSGSTMSTLHLHTPGFGVAPGQRRLALPKTIPPSIEFPGPPSYDYYEMPPDSIENNYCTLNDCYECINGSQLNVPLYDTLRRRRSKTLAPHHFGLSKKGLLQIDYSFNWSNLDRYIAK